MVELEMKIDYMSKEFRDYINGRKPGLFTRIKEWWGMRKVLRQMEKTRQLRMFCEALNRIEHKNQIILPKDIKIEKKKRWWTW